jgi:hypothetical protein
MIQVCDFYCASVLKRHSWGRHVASLGHIYPDFEQTNISHDTNCCKSLENTEGAIKKGQSRYTGNLGYTRQKNNTICVGHHYTPTNTNNVNKTCAWPPTHNWR